jgi:16S rRNA (guanine966-N2)-methyltransferase
MDVIEDARVLDLFAGTGALGLEAISRGASTLTLVEKNAQALVLLKSNVQLVQESLVKQNIAVKISISHSDAGKFLLGVTPKSFDLVFVDPPYELSDRELLELIQNLLSSMESRAVLVIERSAKSNHPEVEELELFDERNYGDTKVWFYRKP